MQRCWSVGRHLQHYKQYYIRVLGTASHKASPLLKILLDGRTHAHTHTKGVFSQLSCSNGLAGVNLEMYKMQLNTKLWWFVFFGSNQGLFVSEFQNELGRGKSVCFAISCSYKIKLCANFFKYKLRKCIVLKCVRSSHCAECSCRME